MSKLTDEELSFYIEEILYGGRFLQLDAYNMLGTVVLLKHPSSYDKLYAGFAYKQAYKRAVADGILTKDQIYKLMETRGIFTDKDREEIESLKEKIKAQQEILSKTVNVPARRDRLQKIIGGYNEKIREIESKKDPYLNSTAERVAQEEKYSYLLRKNAYKEDGERLFWETEREFNNERDLTFKNNVFSEFIDLCAGLNTKIIRQVARSTVWKVHFIAATKAGADLFGRAVPEYTIDQLSLAYWSYFYDSLSEMMPEDRPSDATIEDDDALDLYMKDYFERRSREDAASKGRKGNTKNSAWDHKEVIVTKSNPMAEDIIYTNPKEKNKHKSRADVEISKARQ